MTESRLWTRKFITGTIINFLLVLNYYLLMVIMVDYTTTRYQASSALAGLSASIFVIGALIAAAFLGFGIGVVQSCGLTVAVQKSPAHRISYANSTFYIFLDIGTGVGPFFLGFLVSPLGYRGMYLAMAGMTILFVILFLVVSHNQENDDITIELE